MPIGGTVLLGLAFLAASVPKHDSLRHFHVADLGGLQGIVELLDQLLARHIAGVRRRCSGKKADSGEKPECLHRFLPSISRIRTSSLPVWLRQRGAIDPNGRIQATDQRSKWSRKQPQRPRWNRAYLAPPEA